MPHIIVKLWPGRSEQEKKTLAEKITHAVMDTLHYGGRIGFGWFRRSSCGAVDGKSVRTRHPSQGSNHL